MREQDSPQRSQPRNIENLQPEERGQFYAVPAWRIWSISIFSREEYRKAFDQAAAKPFALMVHPDRLGYQKVWDRHEENQPVKTPIIFRGSSTFDRPSFLLEPLTEEEVQRIDEKGEVLGPYGLVDKLNELFRPEDLRGILERGSSDSIQISKL